MNRRLCAALLAVGMSLSAPAEACTLDALLRLPLKRLLELKVDPAPGRAQEAPRSGHAR